MKSNMRSITENIAVFTTNHPFIGPMLWILAVQYFIVQLIVVAAWPVAHSWKENYISDLGNTVCGPYQGMYVCSPSHLLMNLSFIMFGITIALGAVLLYTQFRRTRLSLIGFILMIMSGVGSVLVGLFPENVGPVPHYIGALLGLVVGNISIVVLAVALKDMNKLFRVYSSTTGLICLIAFTLFYFETYLGIGKGGMERVVSYGFTLWMIMFGVYATVRIMRIKKRANKRSV